MSIRIIPRPKQPMSSSDKGLLIALLFIAFAVSGIFWYGDRVNSIDPNASAGEILYNQYCSACHGPGGNGNASINAPALNSKGEVWQLTDGRLQQIILTGGEVMPTHESFVSNQDAIDIIRYFQTWWTPEQLEQQQAASVLDPVIP